MLDFLVGFKEAQVDEKVCKEEKKEELIGAAAPAGSMHQAPRPTAAKSRAEARIVDSLRQAPWHAWRKNPARAGQIDAHVDTHEAAVPQVDTHEAAGVPPPTIGAFPPNVPDEETIKVFEGEFDSMPPDLQLAAAREASEPAASSSAEVDDEIRGLIPSASPEALERIFNEEFDTWSPGLKIAAARAGLAPNQSWRDKSTRVGWRSKRGGSGPGSQKWKRGRDNDWWWNDNW